MAARYDRVYPRDYKHPVLYVVDTVTLSRREHPVLVVNLSAGEEATAFRAALWQLPTIQANLSIANLDFSDFARAVNDDGVYRGF
jgi:hypothetical protein